MSTMTYKDKNAKLTSRYRNGWQKKRRSV